MPTYDYVCSDCRHSFEMFQSMTAEPISKCPECGGKVKRLIGSGSGPIFKGNGFYQTDYKKSSVKSDNNGSNKTTTPPKSTTESKSNTEKSSN